MSQVEVVMDTNVLVSGLRSTQGASHKILQYVASGRLGIALSVPLVVEYEAAIKRQCLGDPISIEDLDAVVDSLCTIGRHVHVYFLWRPLLSDPSDDMVLELAVAAKVKWILTHNVRDFVGSSSLGLKAISPGDFLKNAGGIA